MADGRAFRQATAVKRPLPVLQMVKTLEDTPSFLVAVPRGMVSLPLRQVKI